jgi:hypothetical protein
MTTFRTLRLTSPHMRGKEVSSAQALLAGHGKVFKHKCYGGKVDGEYGPATAGAVKQAKYRLGYPKRKIDTAYGPDLNAILTGRKKRGRIMLALAKRRAKAEAKHALAGGLRKKVVALAGHYVGTHEYPAGSNMQPFGKWYGANGVPWCAIFVSYVLSHCGRPFKESYVPTIVANARAARGRTRVIPAHSVKEALANGHVVLACFDWPGESPGTADHVGFAVSGVAGDGSFHTIEGNTALGNDSNGGEVMRRIRYAGTVQAFVEVL